MLLALMLTGCSGPAAEADSAALLPDTRKYVALTFDDGPSFSTTPRLLDGLQQRGAAATFFVVGDSIAGKENLLQRMIAEGHQVGNHTWSHLRLEEAPATVVQREISRTEEALADALGGKDYWLRLPYGLLPQHSEHLVQVPLIKWSVDPRDWESRDKNAIVSSVLEQVQNGSIILLHDIYPASVDAALEIVDRLQQEDYWFVTVQELFQLNGITPQPGVMYRSAL